MEWKQCQGDDKGNKGRWYAKCKTLNAAGKPEGFKWGSPKSSPNVSPTESFHAFPTTMENLSAPSAPSINQDDVKHCAIPGCKSTRIAPDCEHSCCRKHCLALSGCKSKTHKLTNSEHVRMAAIDPQLLTPAAHAPSLNLQDQPPSRLNAKAKGKTRGTNEVDLLANTHHPSQLPAVFTTGYAQKELLHQQKDAREAEQCEINQRAASTIQVFGWSKEFEVQDPSAFVSNASQRTQEWKLTVSATVLRALGMVAGQDGQSTLQYFNPSRGRWVNITQGHVLVLPSPHAYLQDLGVTLLPDFDDVFKISTTTIHVPHLRHNLAAERTSVRKADHCDIIKLSKTKRSTSPQSNSSSDCSDCSNSIAMRASKPEGFLTQQSPPLGEIIELTISDDDSSISGDLATSAASSKSQSELPPVLAKSESAKAVGRSRILVVHVLNFKLDKQNIVYDWYTGLDSTDDANSYMYAIQYVVVEKISLVRE
ncbi:hypothetical protein HD554DRAFT_2176458 [Boletus coccyginus]|nr:hypothetical protein HD554DRAFT_2176458 [Boletus coccyginus]